ncbi:uncharacterized protein C8A04DRAFT_31124 [Dichotomopilus funicola]|uniref:Uncharacterized protein n=1 Tax=Dichotomopilus funicola TaxID=1934379 RepID=A0AAN6ZKK1_9PEZI|nr:hypothetical protein C8A04DRAFT_31124 [Dichotomopilus funicola]
MPPPSTLSNQTCPLPSRKTYHLPPASSLPLLRTLDLFFVPSTARGARHAMDVCCDLRARATSTDDDRNGDGVENGGHDDEDDEGSRAKVVGVGGCYLWCEVPGGFYPSAGGNGTGNGNGTVGEEEREREVKEAVKACLKRNWEDEKDEDDDEHHDDEDGLVETGVIVEFQFSDAARGGRLGGGGMLGVGLWMLALSGVMFNL